MKSIDVDYSDESSGQRKERPHQRTGQGIDLRRARVQPMSMRSHYKRHRATVPAVTIIDSSHSLHGQGRNAIASTTQ